MKYYILHYIFILRFYDMLASLMNMMAMFVSLLVK